MQQQQFRIFRALGLSFKAWFSNFIPFTLLAAVLYTPAVLSILATSSSGIQNADDIASVFFGRPIYLLVGLSTLVSPLITYRVIQDLNGTKVSMLTSIKFGLRGIIPAVMFAIMINLLQLIPGLGGIVGSVLSCIWFVTTPAAVGERLSPMTAFTRSAELTAGRRWGIFGLSLLIGLVAVGLMLVWVVPALSRDSSDLATVISTARSTAIPFVITVGVFQLFNGIVQAVAYALLRQDKDGMTYDELAKIFE